MARLRYFEVNWIRDLGSWPRAPLSRSKTQPLMMSNMQTGGLIPLNENTASWFDFWTNSFHSSFYLEFYTNISIIDYRLLRPTPNLSNLEMLLLLSWSLPSPCAWKLSQNSPLSDVSPSGTWGKPLPSVLSSLPPPRRSPEPPQRPHKRPKRRNN